MGNVEKDKAFEEGHAAGIFATRAGGFLFLLGHKAVGINCGRSRLALAHHATKRKRLFESQPLVALKAPRKQRVPQQQDIDPGIGFLGAGVLGKGKGGATGPRLHPWQNPGLDLGNDFACDLRINIATQSTGWMLKGMAHLLTSARSNPHTNPRKAGGGRRLASW